MAEETSHFQRVGNTQSTIIKSIDANEKTPELKIIHAGFHRAGSSSLALMLNTLGFGPIYHCRTFSGEYPIRFGASFNWWHSNQILKKLNAGQEVDFAPWLDIIKCQTVMDYPISYHWDKIYAQYPNAKVILSIRDFDAWYESKKFLLSKNNSVFLKYIAKYFISWWDVLINDYFDAYYLPIGGIDGFLDPANKQKVKELYYEKNIEKAKRLVPAQNLLIYDIKDGYGPLCTFLNVPVPEDEKVPRLCDRADVDQIYMVAEKGAMEDVLKKVIVPIVAMSTTAAILYRKLIC